MKKSLKKIIMTSTIMTSSLVSVGSIVGLSLGTNNSIDKNENLSKNESSFSGPISFGNKKYNSIEELIADYEKQYASVDKYIGNIYKESSASYNYRKIYLDENEVQKYDISKIKPAYSTSYGTLTENVEESKKSFVEQPILAYKDKNGNIHYTEKDANDSNSKSVMGFNSIAFYEIDDYSKADVSGKPKKVKINPLNKNDLDELKKIALLNTKNEKSGFSVSYYYVLEEYWNKITKKYEAPVNPGDYISLDKNQDYSKDHVIYTIDFNGVPLYKFDHKWISNNFFENKYYDKTKKEYVGGNLPVEMKKDPAKYISNFISSNIEKNSSAITGFLNSLENISNTMKIDKDGKLYLSKDYSVPFNKNEKTINFISKDITNNKETFKDKFLDDTKFSKFGITEDQINLELKANKNDDSSFLYTNSGTFKAIREYNKTLQYYLNSSNGVSEQLLKNIQNNMISNLDDIVLLFDKNNFPWKIKYSEYVNSNIYFNESLVNSNIPMIESLEEKNEKIKNAAKNSVEVTWLVYDRRGTFLSSSSNRQIALENAISSAKPQLNEDYVFYNKNGKIIKVQNQINELNVLNLNGRLFGFVTYEELYNCLYEYVKMTAEENGGTITPPPINPPVQETIPFQPNSIELDNISTILSDFASLADVNNLSAVQKFEKFGVAFKITSFDSWNKFIGDGLSFVDKQEIKTYSNTKNNESLTEIKTATMTVQLKDGNKFDDGSSLFSTDVKYTPKLDGSMPDETINGKNTYSTSTQDIVIMLSIIVGVLLIAEIIVLTLTIINKRQKSSDELKLLNKYYKEKN